MSIWRPGLSTPWPINLLGGIACLAVMLLFNPLAGVVALVAEVGLWLGISRREHQAGWGDARRGLYETLVRWALIKLDQHPVTPRSWRPHVLVFVDDIGTELGSPATPCCWGGPRTSNSRCRSCGPSGATATSCCC